MNQHGFRSIMKAVARPFARVALAGIVLFVLQTTAGLFAQVDTGAVLGTIRDQSGGVIPGAKVTLTNEGTSFASATVSTNTGTFIFTPVKVGVYTARVEFQGFQKATHPHISVDVQQQVVVDFALTPGNLNQTIVVTATIPLLQTENASVGQVVGTSAINNLPLNGRNFVFLAQLVAGVSMFQQDTRGLGATGMFAANGNRGVENNYMLDGVDNNSGIQDLLNGTLYIVRPPVDAIQEFKVQTNNYNAEFGHSAGAVLNATVKSGTNQLHGDVWEFIRNDRLDAADFFQNANNQPKGEFRRNQFGFTIGGPIVIPKAYNGRSKTFFFADYEGTRIRQAVPQIADVPTMQERNSGFTDFSDLVLGQSGAVTDALGRSFPFGTILDPATTRPVAAGQPDPVTGLVATSTSFVRDAFPGNIIPSGRLDPNAIKIVSLFPLPNSPGIFSNFASGQASKDDSNNFDARVNNNFSDRDTMFVRVTFNNEPKIVPGPLGTGLAGGALFFGQGNNVSRSWNATASETHSFSPLLINEARVGFSWVHAARTPSSGDVAGVPQEFGIQGIPRVNGLGGLPLIVTGLSQLGLANYAFSDEYFKLFSFSDNLTKIQGKHSLKFGFLWQNIRVSILQPQSALGAFAFSGLYTSVPFLAPEYGREGAFVAGGNTSVSQLLLTPIPSTVPNGVDNVGGADSVSATSIHNIDDGRNYLSGYVQDDWKANSKLTVNLGLRYDFFSVPVENYDAQANFLPGAPFSGAQYLVPISQKNKAPFSASVNSFLQKDGIALVYSNNRALGEPSWSNFGPRIGFAYNPTSRLVVRGGYGIFYAGSESPFGGRNIGHNYPFEFGLQFTGADAAHPITPDNSVGLLENGLVNVPFTSSTIGGQFLALLGYQFHWITPNTQGMNLALQYQLSPSQSFTVAYVGSLARHLLVDKFLNQVTKILPPNVNPQDFVPFPDFSAGQDYVNFRGSSYYNSLQATFERRPGHGLNFLSSYTYSKVRSDARDPQNNRIGGYRAPDIPGFGIQGDYSLADFDIRQVLRFSAGYELPFGQGRRFLTNSGRISNQLVGGWSTDWILALQDGQPFTVGCTIPTAAGVGCNALLVPGQNRIAGPHNVNQWMNPAAFTNPSVAATIGQTDLSPLGGEGTQVAGPGFHRLDFSVFKVFRTSERTHFEFRAEFFNITNTPNFALPTFLNFFNTQNFGRIVQTRDNPNDPRQIQFALKFYF